MTFDGRGTAMRVPFGWVSLLAGIIGGFIFIVSLISGRDTPAAFTLLAASVAAFVAGWMACVSIPRLEQRINGTAPGRRVQPPEHAADPEPDATADGGGK